MNQLIAYFLAAFVALGGVVGVSEDPFQQDITNNVNDVNNAVIGVQQAVGNGGIGYFRATCQDAQQFITSKYQDASKDTALTPKQRELNDKYKEYLVECSKVIDGYYKGETPDTSEMNRLYSELSPNVKVSNVKNVKVNEQTPFLWVAGVPSIKS